MQREKLPGIYTEALSILDDIPYLEQKIKIQEMQEYTVDTRSLMDINFL
jgi:hypothetical protein